MDEKLISSISCFIHVNFMQFYEIKSEDEKGTIVPTRCRFCAAIEKRKTSVRNEKQTFATLRGKFATMTWKKSERKK